MEKSRPKIAVRDVNTQSVLFECDETDSEKAYQFAAEMEELGLDVEVLIPTLGETLSTSLGYSQEQLNEYKKSMEAEIESHDGSCCFTEDGEKIVH